MLQLPNVLKKGAIFTISVPMGVITDFAGNKLAATSTTTHFTCLSMAKDTSAPVITMMSPTGTGQLASKIKKLSVWFSEEIEAATGSITIKYGTASMVVPLSASNVTLSGAKMDVSLYDKALNDATP